MIVAARYGVATITTLAAYRALVLPAVHRELASWRQLADGIPDPDLRRDALSALAEKASNPEATAVLATLAPRRTHQTVIRASTALQVAIDYLDSLGERPGPEPLQNGLQLHRSLGVALTPGAEPVDWYRHHPHDADGGYLGRLVAACQESVATLPSQQAVLPIARGAAERCGTSQSYTHAAIAGDGALEAWATAHFAPPGFSWWEIAAGASSSVAAHALIALAAEPGSSKAEAEAVDATYFPAIGALTVLLDDLIDREADRATGEHNYLRYYPSIAAAVERLAAIVALARAGTERLRQAGRQTAILTGVVAYYLSSPQIDSVLTGPSRRLLLDAAGPATRPLATLLRLRGHD